VRTYGKKPRDFLKIRGLPVVDTIIDVTSAKYQSEATSLGTFLADGFVQGSFDEAWIGFNRFKSALTQVPTFEKILPLALGTGTAVAVAGEHAAPVATADYRYEPGGAEILGALLPLYLRTLLLQTFLENEAGEHAARMAAMDNATRNANELIKSLTLDYNRGRQAAITKELIEIVSGAEAL
jgi:F-type H+-transporting ATPase subunit gamma